MIDIPILLIVAVVFLVVGGGIIGFFLLRSAILSRLNPPLEDVENSAPNTQPPPTLKLDLNVKSEVTPPTTPAVPSTAPLETSPAAAAPMPTPGPENQQQ